MIMADLDRLANHLVTSGPVKQLAHPRRIRVLFNGVYVVDTLKASLIWEHEYYPQLYVPTKDVKELSHDKDVEGLKGGAPVVHGSVTVGGRKTDRALIFKEGTKSLEGLTRLEFASMDSWFEEDEEIYVHPKDPFKRVDTIPSNRKVTIKVGDVTIAESSNVVFLYETTLPARQYLPKTAVNWEYLRESTLTTKCPYKGEANYYDVVVNGQKHQGLLWWYRYPTPESIAVAGRVCAYNEHCDTYIDGVLQERPKSKFS